MPAPSSNRRPAVLKTRRIGYDGKGQAGDASADEAARAFANQGRTLHPRTLREIRLRGLGRCRARLDGQFAAYDPPENVHENHILRRSIVPSRLSPHGVEKAVGMARAVADALDYVGVFAVELFVEKGEELLVNEIAPRVHNSGHWTIDACTVSQFEQHIRAVAGWPLGHPGRHSNDGEHHRRGSRALALLRRAGAALHLYGKPEIRKGRKMGHVTRVFPEAPNHG